MQRVLPFDVVKAIDDQFPWTRDWTHQVSNRENSRSFIVSVLPGILKMIDQIPGELIVLDAPENARLILATEALQGRCYQC